MYFVSIAVGPYQKLMRFTTRALVSTYALIALMENSPDASGAAKEFHPTTPTLDLTAASANAATMIYLANYVTPIGR